MRGAVREVLHFRRAAWVSGHATRFNKLESRLGLWIRTKYGAILPGIQL